MPPRLAHDLLALGIPILVLADPAQLPPPDNRIGYFTQAEPDVLLTEIHRQAADNPILRLADQIRRGVLAFATTPAGHTRGSAG